MTHADSNWNHSLCDECWVLHCIVRGEPGRVPVRARDPETGVAEEDDCCQCGLAHRSGIHVRASIDDFALCPRRAG